MITIPVVFADRSHELIDAPAALGLHKMSARPDMSGGPEKEWTRPTISFGGTPIKVAGPVDCVRGRGAEQLAVWEGKWLGQGRDRLLYLRLGDWYVQILERKVELGYWARHLTGETTNDGWLLLRGTGSIKMGPQRKGGDSQVMFFDRHNILNVWVVRCTHKSQLSMANGAFASFCSGDGLAEVHVQGKADFVRAVADGLVVRDVEPAYPIGRYSIVP